MERKTYKKVIGRPLRSCELGGRLRAHARSAAPFPLSTTTQSSEAFAISASPMSMHLSPSFTTLSSSLNLAALRLTERKKSTPQSSHSDRRKAEQTSQSFEPHSREVPHLQRSFTRNVEPTRFRIQLLPAIALMHAWRHRRLESRVLVTRMAHFHQTHPRRHSHSSDQNSHFQLPENCHETTNSSIPATAPIQQTQTRTFVPGKSRSSHETSRNTS
jgi:hypothetical protein